MSRIGKKPVAVPDKVTVTITEGKVTARGPLGELTADLPSGVTVEQESKQVTVNRVDDSRDSRAAHGLGRTVVANLVDGVSRGFSRSLIITGVGYRAEVRGSKYLLLNLGYSHPILYELPAGLSAKVDAKENSITISGADKQAVGTTAAQIRSLRPPEPYKGKGIRYSDETIRRKEGKAGGK